MNRQLNISHSKHTFPIVGECFPMLYNSPLFNSAVSEVITITQAPPPLTYSAAFAAISVAGQGVVDMITPVGQLGAVSLSLLVIAESGDRKTTVEGFFTKGIKSFDKVSFETRQEELKKYTLKLRLHKKKGRDIEASIDVNDEKKSNQIVEELIAHEKKRPAKPKSPILLCEDVTVESLLSDLGENIPNAFLFTSEGGVVFKGRGLSNTSVINSLWSGSDVRINRKVEGHTMVKNPRLTMYIASQSSAFKEYIKKSTDDIVGNGFTARLLFCDPPSTCGSRFTSGIRYSCDNIDAFNQRVVELLTESAELEDYTVKKTLSFSDKAKDIWLDVCNDIEMKQGSTEIFHNAKGHASKLMENISRVAALFHCFEHSVDDDISTGTLLDAINVVAYYSAQYMRAFAAPPKYVTDAQALHSWLSAYANSGVRYLKKNKILQNGPAGLRKKVHLDAALSHLKSWHPLGEITSKNTRVIDLWSQHPLDEAKLKQDLLIDIVL